MKPSGIEWIGDIPDDWEVLKYKYAGRFEKGKLPKFINRENKGSPIIGASEMNGGLPILFTEDSDIPKCRKDDVLFLWDGANAGLVSSGLDGILSSTVVKYVCTNSINIKYLFYLTKYYEKYFKSKVNGTTIPHMSYDFINDCPLLEPPLRTQQKIADYLDEKCGEIDATIAKQKESIEKLKAYKQSLISETVTKGLDKSAPLKPSGIEWIGDIPDDWEVTKISRLYSIQLGKMLQPEKKSSGDTYEPYICAANLSSGTFRLDEVKYMWISEPEKDIYRLKRDDLLVTEGGDVGISSIWKDDISPCYFQNALHRVVPKKGNSNRFLHYWLIVLKSVGYIDLICNKSTIAHFTKEKFAQSLILSIPLQTQEKIADYLDSKCSQIDKYITEKQNIIQKLDAYKKSLIFECVTGKRLV